MISNLVFHIGDPKNGSSSIQQAMQQKACSTEAATLAYQDELNASALANGIAHDKMAQRKRELLKKKAWAQDNTADIGVISAEFFERVRPPQKLQDAIEEYLPAHAETARVIAYVRPHAGRMLSGYAQRLKTGAFTDNMNKFTKELSASKLLQYTQRFQKWQDVFGDRFTLRPFIRSEMKGQDVVEDFFDQVLQGAPFTLDPIKSTNESLSLEELVALKRIQKRYVNQGMPVFLRMSLGAALGRELGSRSERYRGKLALDRANAERIHEVYAEDAKLLDDTFFGKPLMQVELQKAVDKAIDKPQPLQPKVYFSKEQIQEMVRIADDITALVKEHPHAWRDEYRFRRGQIPQIQREPETEVAAEANAHQVWARLKDLGDVLVPTSS